MAINNITQTISTIPEAAHRGVDVQTAFVIKQEDFQDHLQGTTVTELNTLKDQLNSRIGEINSTTTTMNGYASTASAGASTATTKAGEASTSASEALSYKNQAETFKNNASASATKASQWSDNNYNVEVEAGKYSAKHWSTVAQNTVNNKIDKVTSTDNAVVRFDGVTGKVQNSGVIIDDNGNVGIGVTPYNWNSASQKVIDLGSYGAIAASTSGAMRVTQNAVLNSSSQWIYKNNGTALLYEQDTGHVWKNTSSGINGNVITWTNAMMLDASGNLLLQSGTGALGYGTGAGGTVTQLTSKSTAVTLNKPSGSIFTNNASLAAGATVSFDFYNSLLSITDTIYICPKSYGIYAKVEIVEVADGRATIRLTGVSTRSDTILISFIVVKGATA